MRSVTLPDSDRDVTVGVFHERIDIDYGDILPYSADTNYLVRRCTRVKLTDTQNTKFGDGQFEVRSICNPNDNFDNRPLRPIIESVTYHLFARRFLQ
jgi:hypothetical protein